MIWTVSVACKSKVFYSLPFLFGSVSCVVPWVSHCLFMYVLILNILAKVWLLNLHDIFLSFCNATIGTCCWKTYCSILYVIINNSEATASYTTFPGRLENSTSALTGHKNRRQLTKNTTRLCGNNFKRNPKLYNQF